MGEISWSMKEGLPIPTFHCECGHKSEGFSVCVKCMPMPHYIIDDRKVEQMSVQELKFNTDEIKLKITKETGLIKLTMSNPESETDMFLDRNQAHLLMLYLQEHLGYK